MIKTTRTSEKSKNSASMGRSNNKVCVKNNKTWPPREDDAIDPNHT